MFSACGDIGSNSEKQDIGVNKNGLNAEKDTNDNIDVFEFASDDVNSDKLEKSFYSENVVFNYPEDWVEDLEDDPEIELAIQKKSSSLNMNLIDSKSDGYFFKVSAEDFSKQYPFALKAQGFSQIDIVKVKKVDWQNGKGMYIEFYGTMEGTLLHLVQYIYDDSDDLIIFTFACAESEWKESKDVIKDIMATVKIK